jgi:UDP-N-acetylmuramoylalanine--D-glutamate ligase
LTGRFAGERAVVVGAAVAGAAAARALAAEGAAVTVTEVRPLEEIEEAPALRAIGIDVRAGGHEPEHLDGATLVVASPGVSPGTGLLRSARERGLPVWSELELGAHLVTAPYVAITGTNGKTTTTEMVASCMRAAGIAAVACGNIGYPFPTAAREPHDALVVECSSFQLALQESLHPRVSVLLNLARDHLDWHGSYDAYVDAKARIFARQANGDVHVGNKDDAGAAAVSGRASCARAWFTEGAPGEGEVGFEAEYVVARLAGLERIGPIAGVGTGYRANAAAAAAVALAFGIPGRAVRAGLRDHVPAPHRGDVVAEVAGVRFVDDSKATNVHAAMAALGAVDDAVLIAGGRSKGVDLSPLAARADRLRGLVAIGEAAPELVRIFKDLVPASSAASIEEAVSVAFAAAAPGSTVLLAPACASWDQFRDYRERGDRFAAAARSLHEVGARG